MNGADYAVNNRRMLKDPAKYRYGVNDEEINLHSYENIHHMAARRGFRETSPQLNDPQRLLHERSSRGRTDRRDDRTEMVQAFLGKAREPYYGGSSSNGYGRSSNNHHDDAYGPNGVDNLEQDRAELLRKLEELNYKISRSKEPEPRFPIERNMVPNTLYNAPSVHHPRSTPPTGRYEMEIPDMPVHPGKVRDPFGPQIAGTSGKYVRHSPVRAFLEADMEHVDPQVFRLNRRDPFPPPPPSSKMMLDDHFDPHFQQNMRPSQPMPKLANRVNPDSLGFHPHGQPQLREKWSSDSDNSGSLNRVTRLFQKMGLASMESRKHRNAVAGGAPFILCSNCFNLLTLPRRLITKDKIEEMIRCGSCSGLINIKLDEKRMTTRIIEDSADEANNKDLEDEVNSKSSSHVWYNGGNDRSSSLAPSESGGVNSIDDTKQSFSSTKSEENAYSRNRDAEVNRNKIAGFESSVSSYAQEDDEPVKEEIGGENHSTSSVRSSSPLENYPKKSSDTVAYKSRGENGEISDHTNREKAFLQKSDSPHGSFTEDTEVTEVEVPSSEYPITCLSQDSMESSREEDRHSSKKGGGRNFLKGLVKRSSSEQSRPETIIENERHGVTINGQPIPDNVVQLAEESAGPIQPGDYWYDYHSGFWGVMRHPCLGIIQPFIEQFNYPMPTNCSGGNTGIFMNGRQLHQHDLKLLASRGLPTTRNQFYTIDIFGKVIDEDTGEELYELGKLAPSVVKAGRGFGMRVPKGINV